MKKYMEKIAPKFQEKSSQESEAESEDGKKIKKAQDSDSESSSSDNDDDKVKIGDKLFAEAEQDIDSTSLLSLIRELKMTIVKLN